MPEQTTNHRRASLLVVLFVLLASAYMLTYSGRIASTDTLFLLDATGSLVHFGDLRLDVTAGVRPPPPITIQTGELYSPLPDVGAEPVQMVLAAPLYWLADKLPGVGLAHMVYLFNIGVSAAAGVVVCLYAQTLGYSARAGVLAALLFGLGTIIWPYSKTFFQEPLALLLVLAVALLLETWRRSRYRAVVWLLLALLLLVAAIFSKQIALMAIPGLVLIAIPGFLGQFTRRQLLLRGLIVVMIAMVGILLLDPISEFIGDNVRLQRLLGLFESPSRYVRIALHSYLLSIGGSVWGTSPVILLALPGMWLLHRQRRYRYALVFLTMLLSYAVVTAYWQGASWYGGLSWPPRFLMPVVPFGLLAALPVLDRVLNQPRSRLLTVIVILVAAYAFWVQFSGVTLPWRDYVTGLPPEAGGLIEWGGGMNLVRYLRWVVIPSLWPGAQLDFAWARLNLLWWPLAFLVLALACSGLIWRWLRGRCAPRWSAAVCGLLYILLILVGLLAIFDDPLYQAENRALHEMLPVMAEDSQPGDVVLLSDLAYERFFTNYGKLDDLRIVSLPFHPGEQPSPEQPPEIISDNPDVLLHPTSGPLIYALAETRERIKLLASSGPFVPWSVRPVERFMAAHYYPIREVQTDPRVRLIEYSTVPAPDPFSAIGPQYTTDLRYGDSIRLPGYELPAGTVYAPGQALPISLYWRADEPVAESYKVAWFLRDANGAAVAQGWDIEPGGGFSPTNRWRAGVPVWDNRALHLPDDLAAGDYRLWVVMYTTDLDGSIVNLPVTGSETSEGFIGILPTIIRIEG